MNIDLSQLLAPCVVVSIVLTIMLTEIIKRLDVKNHLKGYRIYVPAIFAIGFSIALAFGEFFTWHQVPFYAAVIFGISVFGYEAILKKIKKLVGDGDTAT